MLSLSRENSLLPPASSKHVVTTTGIGLGQPRSLLLAPALSHLHHSWKSRRLLVVGVTETPLGPGNTDDHPPPPRHKRWTDPGSARRKSFSPLTFYKVESGQRSTVAVVALQALVLNTPLRRTLRPTQTLTRSHFKLTRRPRLLGFSLGLRYRSSPIRGTRLSQRTRRLAFSRGAVCWKTTRARRTSRYSAACRSYYVR